MVTASLWLIGDELIKIRKLLEAIHWALVSRPRFGKISVNDEEIRGMAFSNITLGLETVSRGTKTQEIVVSTDTGMSKTFTLPGTDKELKFAVTPPGIEVFLDLTYLDARGNRSPSINTSFLANDETPPEGPTGFASVTVEDTDEPEVGFPTLDEVEEPPIEDEPPLDE